MELLQAFDGDSTNKRILELVLEEDELSWQQIIYDLVREEQMDPWNINVSTITKRFLEAIRTLTQLDFRVSGKMVLASALLLKIKSNRLLEQDFEALDTLIAEPEFDDFNEDFFGFDSELFVEDEPVETRKIYPRTPQPRKRKVSVYDLVDALETALDVQVKREKRTLDRVQTQAAEVSVPEESVDVSNLMNSLLARISDEFSDKPLEFSSLPPTQDKQDIVLTFIPLLHLTNERRVDLSQEASFEEIYVTLLDDSPVDYSETPEKVTA